MATKTKTLVDSGGGKLSTTQAQTDGLPTEKPQPSLASRAVALSTYFLSGALCINLSQLLGTPLYLINEDWYNAWIAFTKQSFGLLTMTLTQTFSPTKVIVSGDASVRGQIRRNPDGTLLLDFPERLVLIANHQIYTDWLYLWWTAYCSNMHGRLYIILKESLKRIPVIGWGMQFSQFIFLKRNWEKDREHMSQALQRLNKAGDPMWLLLFPEGTNLAPSTRAKSTEWANKNNMKDCRHTLLPRSTGLRFCLQELQKTTEYLYDCTIAYEGVPRGQYAQDIFTLKAGYLEGKPPKSVSMYWRRFAVKNIPIHDEKAFGLWLTARWREKDLLMENYLIHGHFPKDVGASRTPQGKLLHGCGHLEVDIRSSHWYEFLQIFAPMGILAMVLWVFYEALPQKMLKSEQGQVLKESAEDIQHLRKNVSAPVLPKQFNLDKLFDKNQQAETFGNAGMALGKWLNTPEANRLISNADVVYRWMEDPQKVIVDSITGDSNKKNYLQSLQEEENRRKKAINRHHGTFYKDLETAKATQRTSAIVPRKEIGGTFYKDLQKAQERKAASSKPASAVSKGTFWNDLQKEQTARTGTVVTLSSSASSSKAKTPRTPPTTITSASSVPPTTVKGLPARSVKSAPAKSVVASVKAPTKSVATSKTSVNNSTGAKPSPAKVLAPKKPPMASVNTLQRSNTTQAVPKKTNPPASVTTAQKPTTSTTVPKKTTSPVTSKTPGKPQAVVGQKPAIGPKQPAGQTLGAKKTPPPKLTKAVSVK